VPRRVFTGTEFDSNIYFKFRAVEGRGQKSQKFFELLSYIVSYSYNKNNKVNNI
jgi:hypothetical protein